MLQEWLNDLAQEEHEKTASAQFEEVLQDMDIPELRALVELGQEKTAQYPEAVQQAVRPVDMEAARAQRAGAIRGGYGVLGGLGGAAVGGMAGAAAGSPGAALGGMALGGIGGGYLGHRLSKGTAERSASGVPDETYQALSDTDVAERLYDAGRISRRDLQASYDAASPALMAGKEEVGSADDYDKMRAGGIAASDMAPYPYAAQKTAEFNAAASAGRALAHAMEKTSETFKERNLGTKEEQAEHGKFRAAMRRQLGTKDEWHKAMGGEKGLGSKEEWAKAVGSKKDWSRALGLSSDKEKTGSFQATVERLASEGRLRTFR